MKKTLIIGDTHGSPDALMDILRRSGAINKAGNRNSNVRVIHIGDLCNMAPHGVSYRGFLSNDLKTLQLAQKYIDKIIIGNHEAWFIYGFDNFRWTGMANWHQLEPGVTKLLFKMYKEGKWTFVACIHEHVLTHAGIAPQMNGLFEGQTHRQIANTINRSFFKFCDDHDCSDLEEQLFGNVGPTVGGWDEFGGIIWTRFPEWKGEIKIRQIVGHTPDESHPRYYPEYKTWAIDSGGYRDGKGSGIMWNNLLQEWEVVD